MNLSPGRSDYCHCLKILYKMHGPPASQQIKRPRPDDSSDESPQPQPKKPKLGEHSARSASPPHYFHSLSKIWLTREALREFNRTTVRSKSPRPRTKGHRPLTRAFRAELRSRLHSASTPASDFLQHCTLEALRELKFFAKLGGPDLLDLRGYPEPAQPTLSTMNSTRSSRRKSRGKKAPASSSRSRPTTSNSKTTGITKVTKSSGSYDPNFHQRMIDNRIYPYGYEHPDGRFSPVPDNLDQINQMLAERRRSMSPSALPEEEFRNFRRADALANSESKTTGTVIPIIQGETRDARFTDGPDIRLANLANLMTGRDHKAKPDIWYGAHPGQIDPGIRDNKELGTYIVLTTTGSRPCAPNFFVEAKGPSGSSGVVMDQACFDGALGARGIHKLQTYHQQPPVYDNRAYTVSATYHASQLRMYAHHLRQPNGPGTDPEYYMELLRSWSLVGDRLTLLEGMTAFRNAEDWTEAQRNAAIEHANMVAHDIDTNGGDNDNRGNELTADVTVDSIANSFTSQSPFSAQMTSGTTRPDSTTPSEIAAQDFQPPKRPK